MTEDQIANYVPNNWLQEHWADFITMAGKITKTLIIATAVEKKWTKPMKTHEDFLVFFEDEAEVKDITTAKVEFYFFEAGRLKARNYIFEKFCIPLLPKNSAGECVFSVEKILSFVNKTVRHEDLLKN